MNKTILSQRESEVLRADCLRTHESADRWQTTHQLPYGRYTSKVDAVQAQGQEYNRSDPKSIRRSHPSCYYEIISVIWTNVSFYHIQLFYFIK